MVLASILLMSKMPTIKSIEPFMMVDIPETPIKHKVLKMDTDSPEIQEISQLNPPSPLVNSRLDYVDSLRALAALYVVSVHMFPRAWLSTPTSLPNTWALNILAKFLAQGHFAVSLFIVVSGFCLMLPALKNQLYLKGGFIRFLKKRSWRILPPFYVAFLLSAALLFVSLDEKTNSLYGFNAPISWENFIAHLFVVQNLFGSIQSNGVLWTIGVEWQIYFLFPILLFSWRYFGGIKTTGTLVLITYILIITTPLESLFPIQYILLFAFGMLAAEIVYGFQTKKISNLYNINWLQVSLGLFTTVCVVCISLGWSKASYYIEYLDLLVGIAVLCLLVAASLPKHILIRQFLSSKILVFIGSFSYSLYLIHFPLLNIISQYVFPPLKLGEIHLFLAYLFIALPTILGLSYLFFLYVERPSMMKSKAI